MQKATNEKRTLGFNKGNKSRFHQHRFTLQYTNIDSILSSIFGTEDGLSLHNLVRLQ